MTSRALACLYEVSPFQGLSRCSEADATGINGISATWNDPTTPVQLEPALHLPSDINLSESFLQVHSATAGLVTLNPQEVTSSFKLSRSGKIVGGYYPWWVNSPIRLRNLDSHYNLIYLFAATPKPGDTSGAVRWQVPANTQGAWTHWVSDLQYAHTVQGRNIILSVGGAGFSMNFPDRATSTHFVSSIERLYTQWKGFDGLDFNTFEGSTTPDTSELIWIARELKRRHPGFIITAPPAPWNTVDQQLCRDMLTAGALDYCAPQYYDGPQLADPKWVLTNVDVWMKLLGPEHVVLGFGMDPLLDNYETVVTAASIWTQVKAKYPNVRGAFNWQVDHDAHRGYPFARQIGPLIRAP